MGALVRRYAHVPLGIVSLLAILAIIAWLLARRVDGVWDPAPRSASAVAAVVAVASVTPEVTRASGPETPDGTTPPEAAPARLAASGPAVPAERYALESGPFTAADAADRREDELNRLGYATVRFRKQTVARGYVVVATGFASADAAERVARELGRSPEVGADGAPQVVPRRFLTLAEAVTAARALRDRGFEIRVAEDVIPTVIYHIRHGQFTNHAVAQARGEELARLGLENRVVKVR